MQCKGRRTAIAIQLFFGLSVMLLGLLLVLDNLGLLQARRFVRMWPVLLIGLGAMKVFALRSKAPAMAYMLMLFGAVLLLVNFGAIPFRLALAVFLLVMGALLAARAVRHGGDVPTALPVAESRDLDLYVFMSYITRTAGNSDFRGGEVTAIMGACEIDLRGARIDGQAVLNIFAFWGGVEIKVPPDWLVEGRGVTVLGAFEDKSRRPDDGHQRLIVTGMVIMGGVEVKN